MILSSPLNKKWNTALLSFPPILLFNYTSNFGCTIIIPHQSNLVDQESFSNFLFLFWNYLSTTTPELFPLWRNPAISLFPISFHIKKGNKKKSNQITQIVYYASEASYSPSFLKKSEQDFWAFKNPWIYGTLFVSCIKQWGFCHVQKPDLLQFYEMRRWWFGSFFRMTSWLSCRRVFPGKTCEKALNLIGGVQTLKYDSVSLWIWCST